MNKDKTSFSNDEKQEKNTNQSASENSNESSFVKESLLRHSAVVLIARIYSIGLIFIQTIVYIALVGINDFGLFALANATVVLGINLGPFGLDKTIIRQLSPKGNRLRYKGDDYALGSILISSLVNSSIIGGVIWLISPWLSEKFVGIDHLVDVIQIASIYFVFMAVYTVLSTTHQAMLEIEIVALSQIIFKTIGTIIGIILGLTIGVNGIIYSLGVYPLGGSIMLLISLCRKKKLTQNMSLSGMWKLEKASLMFGLLSLVRFCPPWAVLGIIGKFYGETEIGLYTIALQFLAIPSQVSQSINYALLPRTTLNYKEISDHNHLATSVSKVIRHSVSIQILIAIGGLIWAPEIFLLFGEGKEAIPAFLILFIFVPFIVGVGDIVHDGVILGLEKPSILIFIETTYGGILLVLSWFLVQSYSIQGAALAFVMSWLVLFMLISIRLNNYIPRLLSMKKVFSRKSQEIMLYYCLFLILALLFLDTDIIYRLILSLLIFPVMVSIMWFRILEENDKKRLMRLSVDIKGKLRKMS